MVKKWLAEFHYGLTNTRNTKYFGCTLKVGSSKTIEKTPDMLLIDRRLSVL